jgi:peptidoglycan/LPS O-acetylase OafA/YrhL
LFFELLANLCLGLIGRRLGSIGLFVFVAIAAVALVSAVAGGLFGFGAAGVGAMADGFQWQSFGAGCLRVAYSFFAGVLVFRMWSVRRPAIKVPNYAVALLLIAILVAHPSEHYQTAFDLIVTVLIFPILIWLEASSAATGPIARMFTWLGAASYAVYVLQEPLYILTLRIFGEISQANVSGLGLSWGVFFVAFVFLVAIIADRHFDRPVRAMIMARFASPSARGRLPVPTNFVASDERI